MPKDIPAPSDAKFTSQESWRIQFTTASTLKQTHDFYEAEMPKNGWTPGEASEMQGSWYLQFTKGDRTAHVDITSRGDSSELSVLIWFQGG